MSKLAWGASVSPEFRQRVIAICARIGIEPDWLMACMAFETGRTFSPSIRNPVSGATGLIQFMPTTASGLGTSVQYLATLSAEDQLEYVEAYVQPYTGRLHSLDDCYMAILWPKAIGSLLNSPLFSADDGNGKAYVQNRGLDLNSDGTITKGEACARVFKLLDEGRLPENVAEVLPETAAPPTLPGTGEAIPAPEAPTPPEPARPAPTPDLLLFRPPQEDSMPLLGLLASLLPSILPIFQPRLQRGLEKVSGAPPEVAGPFLVDLFSKLAQATGVLAAGQQVTTPAQAVQAAGAIQTAPPAVVAQVEEHALAHLDKIAPLFEQLHKIDLEQRAADVAGRNAAAARAQTDTYDVAPVMVKDVTQTTRMMLVGLTVGAVAAVVAKGVWPDLPDYAAMIIPTLALLAGQIQKERGAIIAYRFDGTPTSNAASAMKDQLAAIAKPKKE